MLYNVSPRFLRIQIIQHQIHKSTRFKYPGTAAADHRDISLVLPERRTDIVG